MAPRNTPGDTPPADAAPTDAAAEGPGNGLDAGIDLSRCSVGRDADAMLWKNVGGMWFHDEPGAPIDVDELAGRGPLTPVLDTDGQPFGH